MPENPMAELPSIQLGAILIAFATFFGALVGSVVPQIVDRRKQRQNLRRSLHAEIQQLPRWLMSAKTLTDFESTTPVFPTDVYDSNTDNIGLLADDEAAAVIEYYSQVNALEAHSRLYRRETAGVIQAIIEKTLEAQSEALDAFGGNP